MYSSIYLRREVPRIKLRVCVRLHLISETTKLPFYLILSWSSDYFLIDIYFPFVWIVLSLGRSSIFDMSYKVLKMEITFYICGNSSWKWREKTKKHPCLMFTTGYWVLGFGKYIDVCSREKSYGVLGNWKRDFRKGNNARWMHSTFYYLKVVYTNRGVRMRRKHSRASNSPRKE